jgi:hypothetical protein
MTKKILLLLSGVLSFWLAPSLLFGHAGNIDENGGHYYLRSYHCHMGGCEMPDTFDFSRRARDSLLTDYRSREKFFNDDDWSFEQDFDGDCQSTRQEMLILTSRTDVRYTNPRNCVVRTGEWFDEYTGEVFEVAVQVDIDHIIPRMYAHTHGGDRWLPEMKLQFSNDPLNLMLIKRREIRRKRDRGPSRYLPRDEFQCEYAAIWDQLSDKYRLQLSTSDRSTISRILEECPEFNPNSDN